MKKSFFIPFFSIILCLVMVLSGCNKGDTDTTQSGNLSFSSNSTPADGYEITTDDNGGTQILDPDGNVIGDTSKGDDITIAGDGTLILTDKDGNTTIINNDGSTVTATSSGVSATTSKKPSGSTVTSTVGGVSSMENTASSTEEVKESATRITLNGNTATISGNGAKANGNDIVITAAGTYAVSGKLTNGRIVVNAINKKVKVILNGADITCGYSSAFLVHQAALTTITAYEGSVNILTDSVTYNYKDSYSSAADLEPDACIFSNDDLTVNGSGKLIVNGKNTNGLTSKSALTVEGTDLKVTSVGHGITGKDSATLNKSTVKVSAKGDGIRSNNAANARVGTVTLDGCTAEIVAGEDGIQAESTLTVVSGTYKITSGGGSSSSPSSTLSQKGLKGVNDLIIKGGACYIDSADDALHSNGTVTVAGGSLVVKSGDDGIHADEDVTLSAGTVVVNKSYEGIEGTNVYLTGGNIMVNSSDDGINIAGGDGSAASGRPGMDNFGSSGGTLDIKGGTVAINANGDGIDVNGSITMSGGTVTVDGPTNSGNAALDFDKTFTISGGVLVAVGMSGMAQYPDSNSTQNILVFGLGTTKSAGTLFNVQDSNGNEMLTYSPAKSYNWICISTPKVKTGTSYLAYTGGSHSGTVSGGIYSSGSYKPGTKLGSVTVSSAITTYGNVGGMGGPGGGPGGPRW